MDLLQVVFVLTLVRGSVIQSASLKTTTVSHVIDYYDTYPSYRYRPGIPPPFSTPGELILGISVEEALQAVGNAWNADTIRQSANAVCESVGSDLGEIVARIGQEGIVDEVCDVFQAGEIEEECSNLWDLVIGGKDTSYSLIPDFRCREVDFDYGGGNYGVPSSYNFNFTFDYNYPNLAETEKEVMNQMNKFDLYNPCSENGIQKINNIIFQVLDIVGPSVLDSVFDRQIQPYSVCGIMRFLLAMDTSDYVNGVIAILRYPAADILEILKKFQICELSQSDSKDALALGIARDLLVIYSGLKDFEFCEFISKTQTREAYLEVGETIITNLLYTLGDEEICNNVLDVVAPLDKIGVIKTVTGFNVTIPPERTTFCRKAAEAFSADSEYVPEPYILPGDVNINELEPFKTPGEFLPGLTFIDLLEIEGATHRAEKIIDGVAIYCIVFEDLFAEAINEDQFDVRGLCQSIKSRDTARLEELCLTALVPELFGSDHPIGLRSFQPASVLVYAARVIFDISDISKSEICSALDDAFEQLSVRDVVKTTLDLFLVEAVPVVKGFCDNKNEALCKLKPYCPLPEQPANNYPDQYEDVTARYPTFILPPYIPSPEEVAKAHARFHETFSKVLSLVLTVTGFDTEEEACEFAAESIDPLSGRSNRDLVEGVRSNIVGILTDVDRCVEVIDITFSLIPEDHYRYYLTNGNTNLVFQFTGYQTSAEFCQAAADAFEGEMATSTESNVVFKGTYNIFAKVAIYVHRVARSL